MGERSRVLSSASEDRLSELAPYGALVSNAIFSPRRAGLEIFGADHSCGISPDGKSASIVLEVEKTGECDLRAWFDGETGDRFGAYYVYVEYLAP